MTRFHVNGKVVDTVDLLRKRQWPWRYDSWPFAILYASWMILIVPGLDFLDAFIILGGLLAVHILVFLFTVWSVNFKCFLQYSKVKDIHHADACKITPAKFCGSKQVVPLHFRKLAGSSTEEVYFDFRKQCFIYSNEKNTFHKLPYPSKETFGYYLKSTGYGTKAEVQVAVAKWGCNVFEYPRPTLHKLMKENCMEPFFVFQVFCMGLECLYGYRYRSLFSLYMLFVHELAMAKGRLVTLSKLRRVRVDSQMLMVYRCGKWTKLSGTHLLPGDIASVGYAVGMNAEEKSVPADMLILAGTAIVNEAILTGESTPQWKISVMGRGLEEHLSSKRDKNHVLFGGTKILQHTPDKAFHMTTPDGGCLALVLRTGFETTQGKLMRTILFSTERVTATSWESGLFILFIVVFGIIAAGYVLKRGLEDPNRSRYNLLLSCSLIITSAIPLELTSVLSLAVTTSLFALALRGIFCTEPFRVPFAGKVDICCFDKTGTLTSDDMEFSGVGGLTEDVDLETDTKKVPPRTLEILASCHALVFVDNKLVGDPLEKAAIDGIEWSYKSDEKAMPKKGGDTIVQIVERHHFASHLKRMAVVVHIEEKCFAFVKGAPETIQERLNDIPAFYVSTYKRYTRRGSRVLALAFKPLPDMTVSEARNLDREVVESGLTFAGFAVFDCPIRGDSATVLSELKRSSHDLVMITGDEALTACHVARQVHIISKPSLILAPTKNKERYEWVSPDETEIVRYSEEEVEGLAEDHDLCIGGDCFQMLLQTSAVVKVIPHVKVFARVSPEQKELIITTFISSGRMTLMCGDGTNDVGALKQAHVGVALLNAIPPPSITPTASDRHLTPVEVQWQKLDKVMDDLAAPMVKLGDASMASPFTAKHASVSPTTDIICQGRSTLVTTLQMFKILGLDCLASAYVRSAMYLDGVRLGDIQATIRAFFFTALFMIISHARPLPTLSAQRPHPSVFCFYVFLSILGQFALHILFLNLSMKEAKKHMPDKCSELRSNLVNTVYYMVRMMIHLATFAVNYIGHPFNKSISENKPFRITLFSAVVFFTVITSGLFRDLNDWLMLVPLPMELRDKLLIWAALMFVGCYTWDRFLSWTLPGKMPRIKKSKSLGVSHKKSL